MTHPYRGTRHMTAVSQPFSNLMNSIIALRPWHTSRHSHPPTLLGLDQLDYSIPGSEVATNQNYSTYVRRGLTSCIVVGALKFTVINSIMLHHPCWKSPCIDCAHTILYMARVHHRPGLLGVTNRCCMLSLFFDMYSLLYCNQVILQRSSYHQCCEYLHLDPIKHWTLSSKDVCSLRIA